MFFSDIGNYSTKKLLILNIIFSILYLGFLVIGPISVICFKYQIVERIPTSIKLTGIGLILFVAVGLYAYLYIKKLIRKLPEIKLNQQRIKFTLEMILDCFPVGLFLLAIAMTKDNVNKAFETVSYCSVFFLAAQVIDGLFLKYLSAEKSMRNKAVELIEIDIRKNNLLNKGARK